MIKIISFSAMLLASCSPNLSSLGWADAWKSQQFSESNGKGDLSSRNLCTGYDGKWVYLSRPMKLVTLRGNYDDEWHQLIDESIKIPERILSGDSRFYRTYHLPEGTEVHVVGAKEFRREPRGGETAFANRYVMLVRLWHPDFHRLVPVFYNMGNHQDADGRIGVYSEATRRCDQEDERWLRDTLHINYWSLKSLPFVAKGEAANR